MAPSFPAPGLRQTYYIPTHTQPQSITFPLHVHMPTRYRDGYISSHACMQPYLCARRHEGCWRPRSLGDGGGMEWGRHPETQRAKSDPGRVCGVGPILHIRGRGTERAFLSWQGGIQSAIAPVPTGAPQNLTLTPKTA